MPDHEQEELARYWDAVVTGTDPDPITLDPSLAQVLHRFADTSDVPGPDSTFIANLMEELMYAPALSQPVARDGPSFAGSGVHRPLHRSLSGLPLPFPARPNRWFAILASAALLLITLGIAGYATLDRDGSTGPSGPSVLAPATTSPLAEDDGLLLDFPLPADVVPEDGFGAAGIRFYTMAPGTVAAWNGELSANNPGIWANYVLEGSMSMVAEGPVEVVRTNGTREGTAAGTEIVLASGDAVIHRAEESAEWTSLGSAEVQIVSLVILSDNAIIYPQPDFWHSTGYDVDGPSPIPAGDWVVRLEELQLEPNGAIPGPESPSTQYGVTRADPLAYLAKGSGGQLTLRLADAPTTVYVFTLEWLGESVASQTPGTPAPVADDVVLAEFPLPADTFGPTATGDNRFSLLVNQATIPANATGAWKSAFTAAHPGREINYILSGHVTLTLEGPVLVIRAEGDGAPEEIVAGTEIDLGPGDSIVHGIDLVATWTAGAEPVEVISGYAAAFPDVVDYPPAEWEVLDYEFADNLGPAPTGPTVIGLRLVQLEPDGSMSFAPGEYKVGLIEAGSSGFVGTNSDGSISLQGASDPTTLFIFSVEPAEDAATPAP